MDHTYKNGTRIHTPGFVGLAFNIEDSDGDLLATFEDREMAEDFAANYDRRYDSKSNTNLYKVTQTLTVEIEMEFKGPNKKIAESQYHKQIEIMMQSGSVFDEGEYKFHDLKVEEIK